MESFDEYTYYERYATSLRMGDIGYQNNKEEDMGVHVDYNSLENYSNSLDKAIKTESKEYQKIGVHSDGYYKQINANTLQIENEYYSSVRPKSDSSLKTRPSVALKKSGVEYIELRSIDNNIFSNSGIDLCQMHFIELLIIHSLFGGESEISENEYYDIKNNLKKVAHDGRNKKLKLKLAGKEIEINLAVEKILIEIMKIAKILDKFSNTKKYQDCVKEQEKKLHNNDILPSNLVINEMQNKNYSFYELCMDNIWKQKDYFHNMKENKDIIRILEKETGESILRRKKLEIDCKESYEDYINNYFSDQ